MMSVLSHFGIPHTLEIVGWDKNMPAYDGAVRSDIDIDF